MSRCHLKNSPTAQSRPRLGFVWFSVSLLLPLLLAGCLQTTYLAEQGWGQLRILAGRQPINRLVQRSSEKSPRQRKLALVVRARRFAIERLGLRKTGAYTLFYDTNGAPIVHTLSAAKKDALRPIVWRFPFIGNVPYLGFFNAKRARKLERELADKGLDTYLRPVGAYSSLGWFDDPVFSSLLKAGDASLVETIIHEMTHTTIFLRNAVAFNESLATFIGRQGALAFTIETQGATSDAISRLRNNLAKRDRFAAMIELLYQRLKALYAKDISRAEKIAARKQHFSWAKKRYREIINQGANGKAKRFSRLELNNAVVLSFGRYLQGLRFHRAVYRRLGRRLLPFLQLYLRAQHYHDPASYVARVTGINLPKQQQQL